MSDDALITKAAEVALAHWLDRADRRVIASPEEHSSALARAVVAAVRDQIAAEALREAAERVRALTVTRSCTWATSWKSVALADVLAVLGTARAEALGATESAGEGENGGRGGREAAGPGNRDSGGIE